ncbi:uncharacterized protein LOC144716510 [Wolffia australiana]
MSRWAGTLIVPFNCNTHLKIFASVSLSAVSINAVFFKGDRIEGRSRNKVIEELSDSTHIAQLLVSKLGGDAINAWIVSAPSYNGSLSVYKEFVPTVNSCGDPLGYDPALFPASKAIVSILSECNRQVSAKVGGRQQESTGVHSIPRTVLIGFSKGGIVLNQVLTEISSIEDASVDDQTSLDGMKFPNSEIAFLQSISGIHFVDVGLNCPGAYLTDPCKIKKIVENFHAWSSSKPISVVLHGTPRQWCDNHRPWIREEKDKFAGILRHEEAPNGVQRICFKEIMYFSNLLPSLQMHFEIIKSMQLE